jgi:F-type H+-transporting ATPase subunit b
MSLLTPDFGLVFWMLLCFLIVLVILGKFGWPVFIGMINERGDYIEKSLEAASEANEKLKNIKAEADQILADAKSDRLEIVSEAKKLRDQIIAEAKNEAEREAAKIKEATAREIQQEKENAIKEIRSQMTELSVGVAEKVLRRELSDSNSQAALINSLLDEINVAKS